MKLSVVIPVSETDDSWRKLRPSLENLDSGDEVIFVSRNKQLVALKDEASLSHLSLVLLESEEGRAKQLNAGARAATGDLIWFLHCDSQVPMESVLGLKRAFIKDRKALHFFDLKFINDGPRLMRLTELGVLIRSRLLRIPFGDQGFFLSQKTLARLGPFDEGAAFGEDHLLVWAAHLKGVRLRAAGMPLYTSARKYQSRGWLNVTSRHLKLTTTQAFPNILRLLLKRLSS